MPAKKVRFQVTQRDSLSLAQTLVNNTIQRYEDRYNLDGGEIFSSNCVDKGDKGE